MSKREPPTEPSQAFLHLGSNTSTKSQRGNTFTSSLYLSVSSSFNILIKDNTLKGMGF
jgi:hypothetical protein